MLRCEDLSLAVPGRLLGDGIALEVRPGEMWAVLGPNGSGKTTLLHTLAGLALPRSGRIRLGGRALASLPGRERARAVGLLLQREDAAWWGTALEYVTLGRFPHSGARGFGPDDELRGRAALREAGIESLADRTLDTLSGGERQLVRLAQLLAQDPAVLLLDEPLQHLDVRQQSAMVQRVQRLARERGKAVMLVLHDAFWPGRYCTHAVLMYGDRVEHGPAPDMLARPRLEALYGCALREIHCDGQRFFAPV